MKAAATTRVTGMREISKFYPPNILPQEIDTDHPEAPAGVGGRQRQPTDDRRRYPRLP